MFGTLSIDERHAMVMSDLPSYLRSPSLATLLLDGVSRDDLDRLTGGEVHRMNLIGGLRDQGYIVTGGRKGGNLYRIIGFETKPSATPVEFWDLPFRSTVEFIRAYPVWTSQIPELSTKLAEWSTGVHEDSLLEVLSYELGSSHTRGFWFENKLDTLIIEKFMNRPRYTVRPFHRSVPEILRVCSLLGEISCSPVRVTGIPKTTADELKRAIPHGTILSFSQAIYDVEQIANRPETILNKRGLQMYRRTSSDTVLTQIEGYSDAAKSVIDIWKETVGVRQRQLSITRDYTALRSDVPGTRSFLGLRDGVPISLHILGEIPHIRTAAQIVEKSLNYSSQRGGRPGTADWNLIETCRRLSNEGIREFNVGHIDGGTQGLADHKRRIASRVISSYAFSTGWKRVE